jgi:hypothetical protein
MIKNFILAIFCLVIIVFLNGPLFSFDSSFFCVTLKKFSEGIYSETQSKYKINIAGDGFILPDTSSQKILIKSKSDENYVLLIQTGKDMNQEKNSVSSGNYLSDSRLLNLDDPELIKSKKKFSSSKNIVNDVEDFVYGHISNKIIGIPIISASEIYKNRTGDCTEHTVLTVSILRLSGVPARALIGMILSEEFEGNRNVFVYHMWAEAFIDGKWILVDSTSPGKKHENRYIAFAYHHLQTEMPLAYLKAVSAMKSFTVEYVN